MVPVVANESGMVPLFGAVGGFEPSRVTLPRPEPAATEVLVPTRSSARTPLRHVWCCALLLIGWSAHALPATAADGPRAAARPLLVTVDDLPIGATNQHRDPGDREAITRGLLAVLAKHRIQAVGLVVWSNVLRPSDERLLDAWLDAGHELGNHSHGHLDYTRTAPDEYIADVEQGRAELAAYLRRSPAASRRPGGAPAIRFFRFPYLREGDTVDKLRAMRQYLAGSGQRDLPVTIDDEDWSYEEAWVKATAARDHAAQDSVTAAYQQALQLEIQDHESRGDELFGRQTPQILLLHANAVGVAQWDRLFTALERSGHRFASADEVLADSAFATPHEYVGRYGCGLWHRIADQRRRGKIQAAVQGLLDESAAQWNAGDLDAFCAGYAEDALFVSPNGVTRGRQAVLDRYKQKYIDKKGMGTLAFDVVEIRISAGMEASVLGSARPALPQTASVAARWTLTWPDKTSTGHTLLVLRSRGGGKWEIVQDASM